MTLLKSIFRSLPVAAVAMAGNCFAANVSVPGGLSFQIDETNGTYRLSSMQPAWHFEGSLKTPLQNVGGAGRGHDAVGDYRQIAFEWNPGQTSMSGWVRLYGKQNLAVFSQTCGAAMQTPPAAFPDFTKIPDGLHDFSYAQETFSPAKFSANNTSTPWLLFDDEDNAAVISPASHFMVASMIGDGRTEVASGFNPNLRNLPKGFEQQSLIALGNGINNTWNSWGRALVALQGAARPGNDADSSLKYLGYWTDNGAAYYYNYDFNKGYQGTLEALVQRYRDEHIPIRYLQLDSWWYYKSTTNADGTPGEAKKVDHLPEGEWNRYGGLLEYKAHPAVFPDGLEAFQKSIGLSLITHNRWIDRASPYHDHYEISGIAAVDLKWWDYIAAYLKASGIVSYEQDWLDHIYTYSPEFSSDVRVGEDFIDDMSRAFIEKGVTMQYCMPYPCYFMQGSRYPNLTTIRVSGDRFNPDRWSDFLYGSRLASALGIWPATDVFMSTEERNMLLSTLSAGPVGIGDFMGSETKTNITQAVRTDGVIVKPDASIVPLDRTYIADAKNEPMPLIASTYTDHDEAKTEYVFAFNRSKNAPEEINFSTSELGLDQSAYVYDYFAKSARQIDPRASFSAPLAGMASAYYVVAPVGKSGIAFLGDEDKFVGTGKQRIAWLSDDPGKLTVGVVLAENEKSVTLHGYSATQPKATVLNGTAGALQYNAATGHFSIELKADPTILIDRSSRDPVRQFSVTFETSAK